MAALKRRRTIIGRAVRLLHSHAEAWGMTGMIALACLLLHDALTARGLALTAALMACYALGFALNDYFDAADDAQDVRKAARNPFVGWTASPRVRRGWGFAGMVGACVAVCAAFAGFGARGVALFTLGAGAMIAYSAPPLRLKLRPGFDLLVHALFVQTFPYLTCLLLLDLPIGATDRVLLALFLLGSLSAQLEQQARDYDLDRRVGRTFATVVGAARTMGLLRLLTLVIGALALFAAAGSAFPPMLMALGALCLPFLLHRFVRQPCAPRPERLYRATLIAAGVVMGVLLWM